jgi:hypothetical protein
MYALHWQGGSNILILIPEGSYSSWQKLDVIENERTIWILTTWTDSEA